MYSSNSSDFSTVKVLRYTSGNRTLGQSSGFFVNSFSETMVTKAVGHIVEQVQQNGDP